MKKTSLTLIQIVVCFLFVTSACSKWNQDPLQEKNSLLEQGTDKPKVPESPKPLKSDAIRIDSVDLFSFVEGKPDEFAIAARILIQGYQARIEIGNLDQFPGALFDANTGKFTWEPQVGILEDGQMFAEKSLVINVIAESPKQPVLLATKTVRLMLHRTLRQPIVQSVRWNVSTLREGSQFVFVVYVQDPDANPSDRKTWPVLEIGALNTKPSLATLSSLFSSEYESQAYVFKYNVDLRNAELTKSFLDTSTSIRAISRYRSVSAVNTLDARVFSNFADVLSTWPSIVTTVAGTSLDYSFVIFDPKAEAKLLASYFNGLPLGATASCVSSSASVLNCRLQWLQPRAGTYRLSNVITKQNQSNSDLARFSQQMNFELEATVPPPTTTTTVPTTTTLPNRNGRGNN
jgi:hypothetical protein